MKPFYIVIGRIPYEDEDTCYIFRAKDTDEAVAEFRRLIQEEHGESPEVEGGEPVIYTNFVIRCQSRNEPKLEYVVSWEA